MPEWMQPVVPGIVIAIVTAIITVRLSVRQFKSERWWERKTDAYTDLLDRLVGLYGVAKRIELLKNFPLPMQPSVLDDFASHATKLRDEVTRGSFLIAQDAIDPIQDYLDRQALGGPKVFQDSIEVLPGIIDKVRDIGKKDLGV